MSLQHNQNYYFVYINRDGSVRELYDSEKIYLQTEYHGADGDRPYIKDRYSSKNAIGDISGFCPRNKIPKKVPILETSNESEESIIESIKRSKNMGYIINYAGIEHLKEYDT